MAKKGGKGKPPRAPDADQLEFRLAPYIAEQPPARWLRETDGLPRHGEWFRIMAEGGRPPPWPGPEKDLPLECIMAQEIFALNEPGDLAVVREALRRLITELGRAGVFYESKGERHGAKTALEAVLHFLDLFRSIRYGDMPLRALLRGLESLELGAVEPMLRPEKTHGGRPIYLQSALFRGNAAGAVELARRSGQTLSQAHDLVADQLNAAGYRLPAAHGPGTITGATVRAWRIEALRRPPGDPMRKIFDDVRQSDCDFGSSWAVEGFFSNLQSQVPVPSVENPPF
jgi:hypothetical protein